MARCKPRHLMDVLTAMTGSVETPLWVLPLWLVGVLVGNLLTEVFPWWLILIFILVLLVGFYVWWQRHRRRHMQFTSKFQPQMPRRARGLILPVSPISVRKATDQERRRVKELREDSLGNLRQPLLAADQQLLERSNLQPALAAIEYHYGPDQNPSSSAPPGLQDVWIITTEETNSSSAGSSSQGVGHLLQRWFLSRHPEAAERVRFHLDHYEGLSLRIDPMDYTGLATLVDQIYEKAPYKPWQIIADITPGTKVISLAVAMGCLPPNRTMQYMTTERHPQTGEVMEGGQLKPLLIDVDPYVEEVL